MSFPLISGGNLKRYQYVPSGECFTGRVEAVKFARVPETTSRFAGTVKIDVRAGCLPPYGANRSSIVPVGPWSTRCGARASKR